MKSATDCAFTPHWKMSANGPMPFGLGAHPYFHAPLDPRGTRAAMQIQGDIDRHWQLDARCYPSGDTAANAGGKIRFAQSGDARQRHLG